MPQAPVTPYNKNFQNVHSFSNTNLVVLLAANTAFSYTVPGIVTQLFRAKFRSSFTAEIYVSLNGTATIPSAGSGSTIANQEMLPLDECRYVRGGDVLSFISSSTPGFTMQLLQLQDTTGM